MDSTAHELRTILDAATPRLRRITDVVAGHVTSPGTWCAKETLGHLIDSAANNHQRFVRAQFSDDLAFPGYEQDAWVRVQQYAAAPWEELVALWRHYNLHLARVIDAVPGETRMRLRNRHNLDVIGWERVPADQPATLDFFMRDYVRHLAHHLAQIFERTDV